MGAVDSRYRFGNTTRAVDVGTGRGDHLSIEPTDQIGDLIVCKPPSIGVTAVMESIGAWLTWALIEVVLWVPERVRWLDNIMVIVLDRQPRVLLRDHSLVKLLTLSYSYLFLLAFRSYCFC